MKKLTARQANWQGGKWITPHRRLGIYLRDDLACVWCGHSVEQGAQLSLDHLKCHIDGGTNESANLVTACSRCNSSRGDRSIAAFAKAVAEYLGHGPEGASRIARRVRAAAKRTVPIAEAKSLIARRGGIVAAVKEVVCGG